MTQPDPMVAQTAAAALGAAMVTEQAAAATSRIIQALWRLVDPYDHAAVAQFTLQAGRLVVSAQNTVANAHTAAQLLQLRAVGINRPVTVTIPTNVRGSSVTFGKTPKVHGPAEATVDYQDGAQKVARTDSRPEKLFERAAEKYRYERSIGKDHDIANAMAEDRIEKLVDDNMILSARLAGQQTLKLVADKDARIIGYRRIIHPELSKGGVCGMCVAASDRMYSIDHLQPIHSRCHCTISPVTTAHDPGLQLNRDDLNRLYADAKETAPEETIYQSKKRGGQPIGTRKALSTSAAALKKTRYQIEQHHELGPVLTRVTGEDVPYFTTLPAQAA